jgi:UDP-N-acetylglucosamine--N-acetylmuramyl-(pentapeptide) pyrophosphoryl-undecaprenol N-acetylglucosamine transferase
MKPTPHNRDCLLFAGGGTAGHLVPGIAAAEQLLREVFRLRIVFATSGKPLERELIQRAKMEMVAVPCRPGPRSWRDVLPCAWYNLRGYLQAEDLLKMLRPRAVVGLGGYVSMPVASAAVRRGVPLVLLEQNVVPGRATRLLASHAQVVCTAFLETADRLPKNARIRVTGNPVRSGIAQPTLRVDTAHSAARCLLVLGGSGGARTLNQNVPRALAGLASELRGWHVLHQCGASEVEATRGLYAALGVDAEVTPFVPDMPQTLATAGLVVSRAGGTTLAELAAAGVPAVVVPYPHAADDHQLRNAQRMAAGGACVVLDERQANPDLAQRLHTAIAGLVTNPTARGAMSAAMLRMSRPKAADDVTRVIRDVAGL